MSLIFRVHRAGLRAIVLDLRSCRHRVLGGAGFESNGE